MLNSDKRLRYLYSGQTRGEGKGCIFAIPPAKAKEKITDRRPGFRIRPRSLSLSVDCSWSVSTSHAVLLRASTQISIAWGDDYLLQSIIPDAQMFPQPQLAPHSEHCLTYDDH